MIRTSVRQIFVSVRHLWGQMVSVSVGGQTYLVSERVAKVIEWLVMKERISILDHVQIVIDCAGASIHTKCTECERL
jgi:hypothetical protein